MTAFEKSLRALDEETARTGAEELLTLLAEADSGPGGDGGQKRRSAAARVSSLVTAGVSPEKGGEVETPSAVDISAPGGARPETARALRAYPETDGGAAEAARKDDETLQETAFPEAADGKDREARIDRDDREDRKSRERTEGRNDKEERTDREDREDPEKPFQTLRAQDREPVDRAEAQTLEKRLQSVSQQRRGRVQPSGEGGENGTHTAAFRGPERQYEGAVGARGTEMRRISDYFRRDSRRYDTGFTRY